MRVFQPGSRKEPLGYCSNALAHFFRCQVFQDGRYTIQFGEIVDIHIQIEGLLERHHDMHMAEGVPLFDGFHG